MDNQQLRELLAVYRPGLDDQDETFAELRTALRNDPELQRQLDARVARDDAIRAKLHAVQPPPGLKTRILAGQNVVRPPVSFWRQPIWLAAAAAIVVFAIITLTRPNNFPAYRAEMVKFVAVEYDLDTHAEDFDSLRQSFAAKGWPADYTVPAGVKNLHIEGGCLRQWHGRKVALLCFETEADGDVWLFVVDRQVVADVPAETPQIATTGQITTASWTRGAYTYILATEKPAIPIQRYY